MNYNDPYPNFDRDQVKGKLFMLFNVEDQRKEKALEIGAAGKLFNIVVNDERTSKILIERETFGKAVTIVPLNKIQFRQLKSETINEAKKIASRHGGSAELAVNLVKFDDQVANAVKYAFNDFLVCSNDTIAKEIAFHKNRLYSCKCVTLDGDVFESGTLTGGASKN